MNETIVETQARLQIRDRVDQAARDRRAAGVRRPKGATRHSLATQLRRFADRLDS